MSSHYLKQCWLIVWRTTGNRFQGNQNTTIQKILFQNVICRMAAILLSSQCVNSNQHMAQITVHGPHTVNSLWPSDAIWQHKSGSTLAQVMACCLTAPSHYLNQCWLLISKALWHLPVSNFTTSCQATILGIWSLNYTLTHWGRVTHICVSNLTIIGSDTGLSPDRRQAIIWTNAGILLIGPPRNKTSMNFLSKFIHFQSRKSIWKCCLRNGVHFISASMC